MDLLSKFDAVTVTPDGRITEQDKAFCAAHQAAYDAARASMDELACIWETMQAEQKKALQGTGSVSDQYLTSEHLRISTSAIQEQIASLHTKLIHSLVRYFNETYHVSVMGHDIEKNLLPSKPDWYTTSNEQKQQYEKQMQSLVLHSDQIVEQILAQLDGRSLSEQALYELRQNCHRAAWNTYRGEPEFTLNKDVIRFSYGCSYDTFYPAWKLTDDLKTVLRGLAHYETDNFSVTPFSLSPLLRYSYAGSETVYFTDCQKLEKLRMFKNRRVDITFAEASYAQEFAEKYLGPVC